ncbi:MAG: FapA family protein [Spirochaetales bacterium]|nr:FapA family protein [Spirochaetales bacterium]
MISVDTLRQYMREQLESDRGVKAIRAQGESLEEALRQASIELDLPVKRLEYEVLEKGSKGMMGVGRRPWTILAYEAVEELAVAGARGAESGPQEDKTAEAVPDKDGELFVRLAGDGVFLKVTKPSGKGARVPERRAVEKLSVRGVTNYDLALLAEVVRHADGEYIKIGDYSFNPASQASVSVDMADGEMKAYMTVTPPGPGGAELMVDEIRGLLRAHGIVHGLLEGVLESFVDYPVYNERILVAEGTRPVNGADAEVLYNFDISHEQVQLKEKNGRVDFKELNLVENVEAGQILARKKPREEGVQGMTVTGKTLPARAGRDVAIEIGKNVKLSDDGMNAIAAIDGQVLLVAGKVNVEPVYTVEGDVNLKTGNILFLGTVFIKGNVEDGFTVKAAGNIEVMGSVGKCTLDAEGEIIVHQGILGKNEGQIRAGKNVAAKFIEHARVAAEENVLASDGIIHSLVDANRRIICQGKRAAIVGGRLRAGEAVHAKTLGSVAGTETIIEVGFDPNKKEQLAVASARKQELEKSLEELVRNISTLENLRRVQKELPEDKARNLEELNEQRSVLLEELEGLNREVAELTGEMLAQKGGGKVSASDRVFPGVKVFIKNEHLAVRNEFKNVTFLLRDKEIQVSKYEPVEQDLLRRFGHAAPPY